MPKNARHKVMYDSCRMLSPTGELMCFLSRKRVKWYVDRGLAKTVSEDPVTIQLQFEPNGNGNADDEFYSIKRSNICVVCGNKDDQTAHHVIPYCYRRHYPERLKSHASHDVLLLCTTCHKQYETVAIEFKKLIAIKYNAPLLYNNQLDPDKLAVSKAARPIIVHMEGQNTLPEWRLCELRTIISEYYGKPYCDDLVYEAAKLDPRILEPEKEHGKLVIQQVDLQEFTNSWRKHFVDTMRPKFMPIAWDAERSIEPKQWVEKP